MLSLAQWLSEPKCPEVSGKNCKLFPPFPCEKCYLWLTLIHPSALNHFTCSTHPVFQFLAASAEEGTSRLPFPFPKSATYGNKLSSIPDAGSCGSSCPLGAHAGTQPWSSSLQLYGSTGCVAEIPLCSPQHAVGAGASEAQAVGKEQERSEKSESEGEGLFRSCLEQSSHIFGLLGFEVEALLLFFTLSLFFKYSILSMVLSN